MNLFFLSSDFLNVELSLFNMPCPIVWLNYFRFLYLAFTFYNILLGCSSSSWSGSFQKLAFIWVILCLTSDEHVDELLLIVLIYMLLTTFFKFPFVHFNLCELSVNFSFHFFFRYLTTIVIEHRPTRTSNHKGTLNQFFFHTSAKKWCIHALRSWMRGYCLNRMGDTPRKWFHS